VQPPLDFSFSQELFLAGDLFYFLFAELASLQFVVAGFLQAQPQQLAVWREEAIADESGFAPLFVLYEFALEQCDVVAESALAMKAAAFLHDKKNRVFFFLLRWPCERWKNGASKREEKD
jgi:hypothetical protein